MSGDSGAVMRGLVDVQRERAVELSLALLAEWVNLPPIVRSHLEQSKLEFSRATIAADEYRAHLRSRER